MTQTSTPRPQISPSEAETLRTHARTIVEGEGAEIEDTALVEAVALGIFRDAFSNEAHLAYVQEDGQDYLGGCALDGIFDLNAFARAALSTIRKHQAGE